MESNGLTIHSVFTFLGFNVTVTVVTTWLIMAVLWLGAFLITRNLQKKPSSLQSFAELVVDAIEQAIAAVAPNQARQLTPLIGTIWIYLVVANLLGLIPGLHSPTRDLSATSALALIVFLSVHWYGIRAQGLKAYLKHYVQPNPILLPFHLVSEISRTLALAIRLFGNMMSLEMAALLVLVVAGFLAPIPLLMLHIIEALVQAYIFGILALVYIASGVQTQQPEQEEST